MNLVQYRNFPSLRDIQNEINRIFSGKFSSDLTDDSILKAGGWSPRADIIENNNCYIVSADIPGVDPKDIKVTMLDGTLVIEGERKLEKKEEKDNQQSYERVYGSFIRRFTLPNNIDVGKISAKGKNGVLEITIPKNEKSRAKEVVVEVQK